MPHVRPDLTPWISLDEMIFHHFHPIIYPLQLSSQSSNSTQKKNGSRNGIGKTYIEVRRHRLSAAERWPETGTVQRENVERHRFEGGGGHRQQGIEEGDQGDAVDAEVLHDGFRRDGDAVQHGDQQEPEQFRVRGAAPGVQDGLQPDSLREEQGVQGSRRQDSGPSP